MKSLHRWLCAFVLATSCASPPPPAPAPAPASNPPAVPAEPPPAAKPATPAPDAAPASSNPSVVLKTSLGDITVELYPDKAPVTVDNFLKYVTDHFYDGTTFHRVIKDFMIQGGGYTADLKERETRPAIKDEANNGLTNARGTLAMARKSDPDSATAQFFINVVDNHQLDYPAYGGGYAVFGKVTAGMDVVDQIRAVATATASNGMPNVPVTPVIITTVALAHPYAPPAAPVAAPPAPAVKKPVVVINTSAGDISVELDPERAPISVENFLRYVREHFYDGTIFHRVINGFMIQGGGFTPSLVEKPTHDPIKNESQNGLRNDRGTIAMARTQVLDSATAEFFINVVDNQALNYPNNGGYAVFGRVIDGMDVVDKIRTVPTRTTAGGMADVPTDPVVINSIHLKE